MVKKKIENSVLKSIKIINVYLNDLQYVENILRDELKGDEYSVIYDNYSYGSLAEVLNDNPNKQDIDFKTRSPYMSVSFSKSGVRFYSGDSSFQADGVISNLVDYFQDKRTRTQKIGDAFEHMAPFIGGILFPTPFILYVLGFHDSFYLIILLLAAIILNIIMFIWSLKRSSNIFYTAKVEGFLKRHKDPIILGVIFAVIGGLAGSVFTKVFGQ